MKKHGKEQFFLLLVFVLSVLALANFFFSERIVNMESLTSAIEKEKQRLGLNVTVHGRFDYSDESAYSYHVGDDYVVVLGKENTLSAVRHEVYHIYSSKKDLSDSSSRKPIFSEPPAHVYDLTGLAL